MTYINAITKSIEAMENAQNTCSPSACKKLDEALTALRALRDAVPDGLDFNITILVNAMVEKYPLGTDFGRYEDEIINITKAAELLSEAIGE
jgi:hypothetical protein